MSGTLSGFGNHHATEALPGALPVGRNSPQKPPYGLYVEQISGTAFTAPRAESLRTWVYRLLPSAVHGPFSPSEFNPLWLTAPLAGPASPDRMRWDPLPEPPEGTDFLKGLITLCTAGDLTHQAGAAIHLYAANRSMSAIASNADGDLLIMPQSGALRLTTEMGRLDLEPLQLAVIPRGLKFRVDLTGATSRGYVLENYGQPFRLPELGPIGANGLASARDFDYPSAAFEDVSGPVVWVHKHQGRLWQTTLERSQFDVVAWHGTIAPYRYDLRRFMAINTVSFDHPDPSIFTVLTSPSDLPGTANVDVVVFPPRWTVAEDTFRPPWFHRNVMSEFMGLIEGAYDAKQGGFVAGGASLHPALSAHGPDQATFRRATDAPLKPEKFDGGTAFMFETRHVLRPTPFALDAPARQTGYDDCWSGFTPADITRP